MYQDVNRPLSSQTPSTLPIKHNIQSRHRRRGRAPLSGVTTISIPRPPVTHAPHIELLLCLSNVGRERERERERAGRGRFPPPGRFGNGSGSFNNQGNHYGPAGGGGGGAGGVGRYGAMAAAAGFRGRDRCVEINLAWGCWKYVGLLSYFVLSRKRFKFYRLFVCVGFIQAVCRRLFYFLLCVCVWCAPEGIVFSCDARAFACCLFVSL